MREQEQFSDKLDPRRPRPDEDWDQDKPEMKIDREEWEKEQWPDKLDPRRPRPDEDWDQDKPEMENDREEWEKEQFPDKLDPRRPRPDRRRRQPVIQAPPVGQHLPLGIFLKTSQKVETVFCEVTYDPTTLAWQQIERVTYTIDDQDVSKIEVNQIKPGLLIFQIRVFIRWDVPGNGTFRFLK